MHLIAKSLLDSRADLKITQTSINQPLFSYKFIQSFDFKFELLYQWFKFRTVDFKVLTK